LSLFNAKIIHPWFEIAVICMCIRDSIAQWDDKIFLTTVNNNWYFTEIHDELNEIYHQSKTRSCSPLQSLFVLRQTQWRTAHFFYWSVLITSATIGDIDVCGSDQFGTVRIAAEPDKMGSVGSMRWVMSSLCGRVRECEISWL
jgi:hypothetical protein